MAAPAGQDKRVGLIGVGLVGTALSERLLAAGYEVIGFDTAAGQLDNLRRLGGVAAGSAAEAAARSRRVILSLPTSEIGGTVIDEIAPHLAPGAIVIDTTESRTRRLRRAAGRAGHPLHRRHHRRVQPAGIGWRCNPDLRRRAGIRRLPGPFSVCGNALSWTMRRRARA
jgi:hypothetical protein